MEPKDPRKLEEKLKALGHSMPTTRRQFLAAGFGAGVGWIAAPGILDALWASEARAEDPLPLPPLLIIDCNGGAGLPGNWLVGKDGGPQDRLRSYDTLGLGSSPQGNGLVIDSQFGAPMVEKISQIHAGIVNNTSPGARANFRMGTICNESQDDNSGNLLSILCAATKVGSRGRYFDTGLGSTIATSGGNSKSVAEDPALRPLTVRGTSDIADALRFGPKVRDLSEGQRRGLLKAILKLSQSQLSSLLTLNGAQQFSTILQATGTKAESFIGGVAGLDPRQDAEARAAFKIETNTSEADSLNAAISFNVIEGNSGPGVITIPGCDYHDGTQTTGDGVDLRIGAAIGRAVEFAHRRQKPLFLSIITDGGVYSDPGTRNWRGDSGFRGLAVVGYYDPKAPRKMRRTQIGSYTDGQAVQRLSYVGQLPARAAWATFANYLALANRLGEFGKFVVPSDFETGQIDAHLFFD